jgi:CPA2 family monovalent cation:H+ antiporter-2
MTLIGLSPGLGTVLAGVVLANSEFRHELESDIEPFKGLLLGLFFITVGAGMNVALLLRDPTSIVILALGVIAVKALVLYMICRVFDIGRRDRWLFTLGLAQAGEFGFILTAFAADLGILPLVLSDKLMLVITLSMLMTPLLFLVFSTVSKRQKTQFGSLVEDEIDAQGAVIIAGIGRFGQIVNRLVQSSGFKTVVLDQEIKKLTSCANLTPRNF